jgi:hypothetical protein
MINIAEILKEKPQGTKLWTPILGAVSLIDVIKNPLGKTVITTASASHVSWCFTEDGKLATSDSGNGERMLFPSKDMLDWSKFAWKKGDLLIGAGRRIIFDKFTEEDYTQFQGFYSLSIYDNGDLRNFTKNHYTRYFRKIDDDDNIKDYFEVLEKKFGIKLNRETLEIESTPSESDFDELVEACKACIVDSKQKIKLQPFDKVLIRDTKTEVWRPSFWGYKNNSTLFPYATTSGTFKYCIPYNEKTKHLLGTTEPYKED